MAKTKTKDTEAAKPEVAKTVKVVEAVKLNPTASTTAAKATDKERLLKNLLPNLQYLVGSIYVPGHALQNIKYDAHGKMYVWTDGNRVKVYFSDTDVRRLENGLATNTWAWVD